MCLVNFDMDVGRQARRTERGEFNNLKQLSMVSTVMKNTQVTIKTYSRGNYLNSKVSEKSFPRERCLNKNLKETRN